MEPLNPRKTKLLLNVENKFVYAPPVVVVWQCTDNQTGAFTTDSFWIKIDLTDNYSEGLNTPF
jgi:hypothetical protein